jgi:predicted transcriptional regulator of viral defense system
MGQRVKDRGRRSEVGGRKLKTMTDLVRDAALKLEEFSLTDLQDANYDRVLSRAQIRGVLGGLKRTGEILTITDGRYRYQKIAKERSRLDIIWHLIRSHRSFTTDEIERLSGAARVTVGDYLNCFRKRGYIRNVKKGHWQLINDPGPGTPFTTWDCAKLKR